MIALRLLRSTVACVMFALAASAGSEEIRTPQEHRRGTEQTFLTFPEWFLVHSPAEYAMFVKQHDPDDFPFWGHIGQFWQSYKAVHRATKDNYPFNFGYHVMIMVIGTSTTVEYALRSAYETVIGRLTAWTRGREMTAEDRFGAKVAQDYVDFIRVRPWYEFDFFGRLCQLWSETSPGGSGVLRKWERKYALTTEYGIKGVYGWLIRKATQASYDAPVPVTAALVDRLPDGAEKNLPELKVLQRYPDGSTLASLPRYEAFTTYSASLSKQGASFQEIAGNRSVILVSLIVPTHWQAGAEDKVLFEQPIITRPTHKRIVLIVPVASLAGMLNRVSAQGFELEHVYDY
jgi:hypothetical protein